MEESEILEMLDAVYAYDIGAIDSGVKNDELKEALKEHIRKYPNILAIFIREKYLSESAIKEGYGLEDVSRFIEWLKEETGFIEGTKESSELPVHNINTRENFSTIHEAIDAVNTTDGHIIAIDVGIMPEQKYRTLYVNGTDKDSGKGLLWKSCLNQMEKGKKMVETLMVCMHCRNTFKAPVGIKSLAVYDSIPSIFIPGVTCPLCGLTTDCTKETMIVIEKRKTMFRLVCRMHSIRFRNRATVSLGDIFEVPEEEARGLVNLGYAEVLSERSEKK